VVVGEKWVVRRGGSWGENIPVSVGGRNTGGGRRGKLGGIGGTGVGLGLGGRPPVVGRRTGLVVTFAGQENGVEGLEG
jgi:hypothetical protein